MECSATEFKSATPFIRSDHIADLVRHYGSSTSLSLLDPICKIFTTSSTEGIIGYRMKFGRAIVFGDPVCTPEAMPILVEAFHHYCKQNRKKIIYIAVSQEFKNWALKNCCEATIEIGFEVILNPQDDYLNGRKGRKVRLKINQPLRAGVTVHEFFNNDLTLRQKIEEVAHAWIHARRGPQIYLWHPNLFDLTDGKRWFYAKHQGKIIGILMLNQLRSMQGWAINFIATLPDATKGTSELLLTNVLNILKNEQCSFLSVGIIPGADLGETIGVGTMTQFFTRKSYKIANKLFKLNGKIRFWRKFNPNFQNSYLVFENKNIGFKDAMAIICALNGQI